jgi:hypothetical protein
MPGRGRRLRSLRGGLTCLGSSLTELESGQFIADPVGP